MGTYGADGVGDDLDVEVGHFGGDLLEGLDRFLEVLLTSLQIGDVGSYIGFFIDVDL